MPSIAQIPISNSPPSGKKRKREQFTFGGAGGEEYTKLASIQYPSTLAHTRSLFSIESSENTSNGHSSSQPRLVLTPRGQIKMAGRTRDAKRQRIALSGVENQKDPEDQMYTNGSYTTGMDFHSDQHGPTLTHNLHNGHNRTTPSYTRAVDLNPCHICHQKPKVRTDLDSYGDCECCGKRTCFICMRECLGPTPALWEKEDMRVEVDKDGMSFTSDEVTAGKSTGKSDNMKETYLEDKTRMAWPGGEWEHRGMICSRCCVERGADGEVRCLMCLRAEERR